MAEENANGNIVCGASTHRTIEFIQNLWLAITSTIRAAPRQAKLRNSSSRIGFRHVRGREVSSMETSGFQCLPEPPSVFVLANDWDNVALLKSQFVGFGCVEIVQNSTLGRWIWVLRRPPFGRLWLQRADATRPGQVARVQRIIRHPVGDLGELVFRKLSVCWKSTMKNDDFGPNSQC